MSPELSNRLFEREQKYNPLFIYKVMPGYTSSWEDFVNNTPKASIALDGLVNGRSEIDPETQHANFDHHGPNRFRTPATCEQVYSSLQEGLLKKFSSPKIVRLYTNDCDQDVSLSLWLFRNHSLVENVTEHSTPQAERLAELVKTEGELDRRGGINNMPRETLENISWIFEPFNLFRSSGQYAYASPGLYNQILSETGVRIGEYVEGRGKTKELEGHVKKIIAGKFVDVVEETGPDARLLLGTATDKPIVILPRYRKEFIDYSILCTTDNSRVDSLTHLWSILNEIEPGANSVNNWGGGNSVGGSPRMTGSKLSPEKVYEITENMIIKQLGTLRSI
jgi:hypothetical protein